MPVGVRRAAGRGVAAGPPVPVRRRGPDRPRPGRVLAGAGAGVSRGAGAARARGPLPMRLTPLQLLATGLACAIVVVGLGLLGSVGSALRSGPSWDARGTHVTWVRPGETLGEVAHRAVPGVAVATVADRIRVLNQLGSSALRPGRPLRVPDARSNR